MLSTIRLKDDNDQLYLDEDLTLFPTDIGLLTRLQTLSLCTGSHAEAANVEWISQLTSLQGLTLSFGGSHRNLIQASSLLTKLTHLNVEFSGPCEASVLSIDIAWHRLQALQDLSICNFRLELGDGVADLPKLLHLTKISFVGSTTRNDRDRDLFGALVNKLSTLPAQLKLLCDSEDY